MVRDFSSVDIHFLLRDLQDAIGCRIDKLYTPAEGEVILQLRRAGGKMLLRFVVPHIFYVASLKDEMPERPSGWCGQLRKLIEGAKIVDARQPQSERLLHLALEHRGDTLHLFMEFFGKGNIIITDDARSIQAVLYERELKERTVKRGEQYVLPSGVDQFHMERSIFIRTIQASTKKAVSAALATSTGLGAFWAVEICARAGIDPAAAITDEGELRRLHDSLMDLLAAPSEPHIVLREGIVVDALPLPFKTVTDSIEPAVTFSAALEKAQRSANSAPAPSLTRAVDEQRIKLQHAVDAQHKAVKRLVQQQVAAQRAGELLYERYTEMKHLLDEVAAARKKGKDAVEAVLRTYPYAKEYKAASGDIVLEFPDEQAP